MPSALEIKVNYGGIAQRRIKTLKTVIKKISVAVVLVVTLLVAAFAVNAQQNKLEVSRGDYFNGIVSGAPRPANTSMAFASVPIECIVKFNYYGKDVLTLGVSIGTKPEPRIAELELLAGCPIDSDYKFGYFFDVSAPAVHYSPYNLPDATYAPVTYGYELVACATAVFKVNGEVFNVQKLVFGGTPIAPPVPTWDGHEFKFWVRGDYGSEHTASFPSIFERTEFTAVFVVVDNVYTFSFVYPISGIEDVNYTKHIFGGTGNVDVLEFFIANHSIVSTDYANYTFDGIANITAGEKIGNKIYEVKPPIKTLKNYEVFFNYVNADGYAASIKETYTEETNILTMENVPSSVLANVLVDKIALAKSIADFGFSSGNITVPYIKKDITIKSSLGEDIVLKVWYMSLRDAFKKSYTENDTYFKFFFANTDYSDKAVNDFVDKEVAANPDREWQKCDYYFYYNLLTYMYDKPILEVDSLNPTYYFHPTHTLKQFYPSFDSKLMFYYGYTAEGLTKLPYTSYGAIPIHVVTDSTKPIVFDVDKKITLKVVNAENGLTYLVPFNSLKVIAGRVCFKIDLNDPFVLRREFFGNINPYTVIGALAYDITVTGSDDYKIENKTLCIYLVPDPKANEYVVNVYFIKKEHPLIDEIVPDGAEDVVEYFKDLGNTLNNFFSKIFNFFGGMDTKLIITIASIILVLLVTAPLWIPLIPFLLGLLFKLITLPVRLIVMLIKKIAKK